MGFEFKEDITEIDLNKEVKKRADKSSTIHFMYC